MRSTAHEENKEPQLKDSDHQRPGGPLPSPILILSIIALSIFALEFVVMTLLAKSPPQSNLLAATINSSLLLALLSPILYVFMYRPFVRHIKILHQAEDALRKSQESQLREVLATSLDGYWMSDDRGVFLEVNDAYCRMTGYSRDELLTMCISDIEANETPEETAAHIKQLIEVGSVAFETRHRHKDGGLIEVEISANFQVSNNIARIYCFIRDITERKRADAALHLSEERLRIALEGSGDTLWDLDFQSGKTTSSKKYRLMLGYDEGEIGDSLEQWRKLIHPDDLPGVIFSMQDVIEGRSDIYSHERRMKCKDGSWKWILKRGTITSRDANGKPLFMVGTNSDITERKIAEENLRLGAMVYENSSEAIVVTDASNRIIAVNPAFEEMTGYSKEEAIGKNPSFMSSGRHDQDFYQKMWRAISSDGHWQGEMWDKRKNGEIYAKALSINVIRNRDGSVHRHVAFFSDVTERKQSEELIWKQANFDTLTDLPNRRMFLDRLQQDVKKADRSKLPVALLLIDLDRFKEVNDTLGHAAGDKLLREAAFRIRSCVRTSDTVARLGGDEFTVILPDIADLANLEEIAQKIIAKLSEYFEIEHETVYVSASVGITLYPSDASNIEDLMKNADQAMYAAKHQGRNCFSYFTHSLQEHAQTRLRLINDLRLALPRNEFQLHFQPIVNLATGRICKAEALLRWQHPERGMVSPAEFIPLAEESGLIHEIGDWVFRESARWVQRWRKEFDDSFQISVNKSPVQFKASHTSTWVKYLSEMQVPGQHIVVEITEGLLLNAETGVSDKLLAFRDAGIQVAIDDFGTGYSSLSYLKKFDIDYLKIDQSFVRNLGTESSDLALCEAIIVMAHKLGLKVIAEGVETEAQRAMLAAAGCDFAQGYLLSRPLPPEQLEQFLLQHSQSR